MNNKIAAIEFAASNGIVFVEDADRPLTMELEDHTDTPQAIGPVRVVTITVVHAVDGIVSIDIQEGGEEPEDFQIVADETLELQHGRLRIRDVPDDNLVTIGFTPGPVRVRVYTDSEDPPTRLLVLVPTV